MQAVRKAHSGCRRRILSGLFPEQIGSPEKSFDSGRALWLYGGNIRKSVLDYKYQGMKSYTDFYAEEVVRNLGGWIRRKRPEALIPVPLHSRKKRMRGFNQAELLARAVGKRMGIPENGRILYRNRWTEPQKGFPAVSVDIIWQNPWKSDNFLRTFGGSCWSTIFIQQGVRWKSAVRF